MKEIKKETKELRIDLLQQENETILEKEMDELKGGAQCDCGQPGGSGDPLEGKIHATIKP